MIPHPVTSKSKGSQNVDRGKEQAKKPLGKGPSVIQQSTRHSNKKIKTSPCSGFKEIISRIRKVFVNLIKRKKKSVSSYTSSSNMSSSIELTITKNSYIDIALSLNKAPLSPAKSIVNNNPVQFQKDMDKERKKIRKELCELAKNLNAQPKVISKNSIPRGQENLGNSCYMNAALQCLESAIDPTYLDLLKEDLSRKPKESMEDLEERLLNKWSPIPNLNSKNLKDLEGLQAEIKAELEGLSDKSFDSRKDLEQELSLLSHEIEELKSWNEAQESLIQAQNELQETNDDRKRRELEEQISTLKHVLLSREDRILFKWSYLLLLQAKSYGTQEQVKKALKEHHRVVFVIGRHMELPYQGRNRQQDAAFYLELWHSLLNKQIKQASFKTAQNEDGTTHSGGVKADPITKIMISVDKDFRTALEKGFYQKNENTKLAVELGIERDKLEESLKKMTDKDKNKKATEIKIQALNDKIAAIDNWQHNLRQKAVLNQFLNELDPNDKDYKENKKAVESNLKEVTKALQLVDYWDRFLDYDEHYEFLDDAPPEILNIQMKRFGYDANKKQSVKENKDMPYSLDKDKEGSYEDPLDLSNYFKNVKDESVLYELVGISCHQGSSSPDQGHYVAYVKRKNKWYFMNDGAAARPVSTNSVPFAKAYTYTYKRIQ